MMSDHFNIITIVIITAAYIHAAPRVAVLSSGLMARGVKTATTLEAGLCRSGAVRLQDKASASQRRFVFEMLEKDLNASVTLFLSTNNCPGKSWEQQLYGWYFPWLTQLSANNCGLKDEEIGHRCLVHRGLEMLLAPTRVSSNSSSSSSSSSIIVAGTFDVVIMTRPDLIFEPRGAELVRDMVVAAISNEPRTIVWPFKCESGTFDDWGCVADTIVAVPGEAFKAYSSGCLGHLGCHPDAHGARNHKDVPRFVDEMIFKGVHFDGHSCYRCVYERQRAAMLEEAEDSSVLPSGRTFKDVQNLAACVPEAASPEKCDALCRQYSTTSISALGCRAWTVSVDEGCCMHSLVNGSSRSWTEGADFSYSYAAAFPASMSAMLPEAAPWSDLVHFRAAIVHEELELLVNTRKRQGKNGFYSMMDGRMEKDKSEKEHLKDRGVKKMPKRFQKQQPSSSRRITRGI